MRIIQCNTIPKGVETCIRNANVDVIDPLELVYTDLMGLIETETPEHFTDH